MTVVRGDAARRLMARAGRRRVSHTRAGSGPVWTASLLVPDNADGPATARRFVRTQLAQRDPDFPLLDTTIVVSELIGNALRHGSSPVLLNLARLRDGPLSVGVSDGGSPTPELHAALERHRSSTTTGPGAAAEPMAAEGDRGLEIVGLLSHSWGVRVQGSGKSVWALLGQAGTS